MNLYRYVANNPLNNTDPSGLCGSSINYGGTSYLSNYTSYASSLSIGATNYTSLYQTSGNLATSGFSGNASALAQSSTGFAFSTSSDSVAQLGSIAWAATKGGVLGLGQVGLNVANAVTDLPVDVANLAVHAYNFVADTGNAVADLAASGGWVLGHSGSGTTFPTASYYQSWNWSQSTLVDESNAVHDTSVAAAKLLLPLAAEKAAKLASVAQETRLTQFSEAPNTTSLPISAQKQAGHIPGTPQYANRINQGKTTSAFFGEQSGNAWTQRAWQKGTPTADPNIKIYDAGVSVGTGPNGGMQTQIRVVRDSQGRIHGTPWGPEKR